MSGLVFSYEIDCALQKNFNLFSRVDFLLLVPFRDFVEEEVVWKNDKNLLQLAPTTTPLINIVTATLRLSLFTKFMIDEV